MSSLRRPSPHFRRSINIRYDLGDAEHIAGLIPTPNMAKALSSLVLAMRPDASQRSHLLYGPYGSGKSLFATVLAAILARDGALSEAVAPVLARLRRDYPADAERVDSSLARAPRLLPVVLSGDEGPLSLAMGRALDRTLTSQGVALHPHTVFRTALETIRLWQDDYPDTYDRLAEWLVERGQSRESLAQALEQYNLWAYSLFLEAYPDLTAGASFDRHNGQSVAEIYQQVAAELPACGYQGIVVLWDEFGRFLETRIGEPSGSDASMLQDFAEVCNSSGEKQIHLVLITHKEMSQYASHLPPEYQQDWERIAGRFRMLDISGDPEVSYRLIADALGVPDPGFWAAFLERERARMDRLLEETFESGVFRFMTPERIRELILEGCYPLHPLTSYCLPRLSNRVAQNERTLFTFLASEEPDALGSYLTQATVGSAGEWLRLGQLWDYFASAVKGDLAPGGVHQVWAGVEAALRKAAPEDSAASSLIKTLGVLTVVGDTDELRPTTEMLCFACGMEERQGRQAAEERLRQLARRKVVIFNQIEGTWQFFSGSGVDLEAKLGEARDTRVLKPMQRRQLLERIRPLQHLRARRFNQEHGMTRFFWSLYRTPQELAGANWELTLREARVDGHRWEYADGFIVYVPVSDDAELNAARQYARALRNQQVVVVVPRRPLLIDQLLLDWLVLDELNQDARFKELDPERIGRELEFYLAETAERLTRALDPLLRPETVGADWYHQGEVVTPQVRGEADASRLLSKICDDLFAHTPRIFNELLNKREPSAVQARAAEKVIDALFVDELSADLGLTGSGPDVMAVRTAFRAPGILRRTPDGKWVIGRPDGALGAAWDEIDTFLQQARIGPKPFSTLLEKLQSPPYGLRLGILPLLVGAAMRGYLEVATIRMNQKTVAPVTGMTVIDLCRQPDQYAVELIGWGACQEAMKRVLERCFGLRQWVLPEERRLQPFSYLSLGILRWLQSCPRYARDTAHLSADAAKLRSLIRQAGADPARVLFEDLPRLLVPDSGCSSAEDPTYELLLEGRLRYLLDEVTAASAELQRRLDEFAIEHFASDSPTPQRCGHSALSYWLNGIEQHAAVEAETLRFGDTRAEGLLQVLRSADIEESPFWDQVSRCLMGVTLRDWNDASEERFKATLLETKGLVERQALSLAREGEAVQLQIRLPDGEERAYRFLPTDLSPQGQRILQNFKSTLETAGRPLTADERRQVVLALLHHVMGEGKA